MFCTVAFASRTPEKKIDAFSKQANKIEVLTLSFLGRRDSGKPADLEAVKKWNQKTVKIPGFMIPLTPDKKDPTAATDFLFVPGLQSCSHVPPPPPSQTVYVKMKSGQKARMSWEPIWVTGVLSVLDKATKENPDALYTLEASGAEKLSDKDRKDIYEVMLKEEAARFDCNGRDKLEPVCVAQRKSQVKNNPI